MAIYGISSSRKESSVVDNRDKYIGGSDIAKVKDSKDAIKLIEDKQKPQREFVSIYTEFGNIAEPLIRERVSLIQYGGDKSHDAGVKIEERPNQLGLRGNCDINDTTARAIGEIKTVGEDIYGSKDWGKKLQEYKVQCAFYQGLFEYENGFIAVIKRPNYLIDKPFSEWTYQEMKDRQVEIEVFIQTKLLDDLKIIDCPLDGGLADEVVRRLNLIDDAYTKYGNREEIVSDYQELLNEYVELENQKAEIQNRLDEIMGVISKHEVNEVWQVGEKIITYTAPRQLVRKAFDSRAFSKEYADLYAKYQKESTVNYKASLKIK